VQNHTQSPSRCVTVPLAVQHWNNVWFHLTDEVSSRPRWIMQYKSINAVQIRATMLDIEPQVWRRLIVPWEWNLAQVHLVIQAAFNWYNYHLHEFLIGGLRYGDTGNDEGGFEDSPRLFEEQGVRLLDFARNPGTTLTYVYDFGDHWCHALELEDHHAFDTAPKLASCIGGGGARPPEDVGGVGGYRNFLTILADPRDPEHAETKRWCGGHFDPEWFDLALIDKDVRNALRPNARRGLHQPKPKRAKTGG
jgi:hypothetical protein